MKFPGFGRRPGYKIWNNLIIQNLQPLKIDPNWIWSRAEYDNNDSLWEIIFNFLSKKLVILSTHKIGLPLSLFWNISQETSKKNSKKFLILVSMTEIELQKVSFVSRSQKKERNSLSRLESWSRLLVMPCLWAEKVDNIRPVNN